MFIVVRNADKLQIAWTLGEGMLSYHVAFELVPGGGALMPALQDGTFVATVVKVLNEHAADITRAVAP
jgi:hypothetical protein